jgi:hypothetical protein
MEVSMKKQSKKAVLTPEVELAAKPNGRILAEVERPKAWESFFRCQRCPMLRSQLLVSLMAGTRLEAERVPVPALLDAVLIAAAARQMHESEIVDNYQVLLDRTEAVWSAPNWCARVFSSIHGRWADRILKGATGLDTPEEGYIPSMVGWYLQQDPPDYFSHEMTEADLKKRKRAA